MLTRTFSRRGPAARTASRAFGAIITPKERANMPEFYNAVQFSKKRLTDFGELPRGEIPNALKYSPEHTQTRLPNGVQVVTETYPGAVASVSVFVKAGSRFESIDTSGTSHFLTYYLSKASKLRNRNDFREALDQIGGHIEVTTGREIIGFTIKCNEADVNKAVELLAEAISQPDFNSQQVDTDKEFVHRACLDICRDQFQYLREALFYTSFRQHMVGQSEFGIRDNIPNLKASDLEEFHAKHFVGSNVVFVVTGRSEKAGVIDAVQNHTQALHTQPPAAPSNTDKPLLTPVVMFQRDDEMYNLNNASGWLAPAYGDEMYFPLKYFEKILGDFNAETDGTAHLNAYTLVTNPNHRFWAQTPGVHLSHTKYEAFSDFGLFTMYVHGNDFWGKEIWMGMNALAARYAKNIDHYNLVRGRAAWFNELLKQRASKELNEDIAREIFYLGRRVTRTEYASRFSALMDPKAMQPRLKEILYGKEIAMATWGPTHNLTAVAYYNRNLNRSTRAQPYVFT